MISSYFWPPFCRFPLYFCPDLGPPASDREPDHAATPCFCAGLAPPGKRIDYGRPGNFLWTRLRAFLDRHPLPRATIIHKYAVASTSCVKNRMREFRTSGPVRGGDGDIPTYSATPPR